MPCAGPTRCRAQVRKVNFFAAFVRDIPSFGCGSAALGPSWSNSLLELRGSQVPIVSGFGDRRQAADDFVPVFAEILAAEDLA